MENSLKTSAKSAEEAASIIVDANSPANHRLNLSEMVIAWMQANHAANPEHNQDVYLTFVVLNQALKVLGDE